MRRLWASAVGACVLLGGLITLSMPSEAIEPLSLTAGGVGLAVSAGYAFYNSLRCKYEECCSEPWIRKIKCSPSAKGNKDVKNKNPPTDNDYGYLEQVLKQSLHGQPLVYASVPGAVAQHLCNPNPKKALVMSFHGWTGGGKNYASMILANYLYKKGLRSDFVKLYVSTLHFPHQDEIGRYKRKLQKEIVEQVKKCPQSMFIFDEIDKMPAGLIDIIKPFLDFHTSLDGVDYRKCIFVFLSNTAGDLIARQALTYWKDGIDRNRIALKDMESVIGLGSFNEKGGLYRADIVDKNLIDVFVPFLPLEKRQINQCIRDDFHRKNVEPTKKMVDTIADELEYIPQEFQLYSSTGCKKVQHKVQQYLHGGVSAEEDSEEN
ncbi:torsin-1A-like isoform X1 [Varroa destructor]|uniref:Torsin-1A C-terminal domain-containing protein n=1 Tax=Varroa destructor TaxID=109461 RepID=A0A7M7KVI5_VARDE|nr:torsin-1A-like isoform X1 [Varroa destructor]